VPDEQANGGDVGRLSVGARAQAVVLADSFNKRFQPLTTALPKVGATMRRRGPGSTAELRAWGPNHSLLVGAAAARVP